MSQGNIIHYASIIKQTSVYKVHRYPHWQGLLYLTCYLYFRYRETNDKLVTAFCYLTRKYHEAAKAFAKQKIADELELIREKLKYAGDILHYFVDENVSNVVEFGEIRQQAFGLIPKEEIHAISQHLGKRDFDLAGYEWEYIDKQSRKIANSLRKLFIAIDIECEADQKILSAQITLSKQELTEKRKIITLHQEGIKKSDNRYLWINGEVHTRRFEFYLYHKISRQLDRGKAYVTESEKNKRLEDDLIPIKDWENDRLNLIQKTGLQRLSSPITQTLDEFEKRLERRMDQVAASISGDTNEFVKLQPRSSQLAWTLANRRWRDDVVSPS
ncbi:hypothetical protein [Xenorhabdus poinarii]|uniref:hypothetical protein n=1 Tax=Xenorhabdus poinarii TaxID=40577 RepID=UPI0012FEE43D|nr:hypothetical protein [Xenorhabdus poinarii]